MGGEREESMDILPSGMADLFTEFLGEVQNKMAELVTDADALARKLDGKDNSTENQNFEKVFHTMAEGANKIIGVVKQAAEMGIEKLEEKNKDVGSSYQSKCIAQIESGKDALAEQEYAQSQLTDKEPQTFTTAEKAQVQSLIEELANKWISHNDVLCDQAEELSNHGEKNELSEVCFKIADQIAEIVEEGVNAMNAAGFRMEQINNQRIANTETLNQSAESSMEAANQEITNILQQLESDLDL